LLGEKIMPSLEEYTAVQGQQDLSQIDVATLEQNSQKIKIKNWHDRITNLKAEIAQIQDINWLNLPARCWQKQNLDDFYKHLNKISQEVNYELAQKISLLENNNAEYNLYFAQMLQILSDVNMVTKNLYQKDTQVFMFNWTLDSMLQ
jgi:hypothetical protein